MRVLGFKLIVFPYDLFETKMNFEIPANIGVTDKSYIASGIPREATVPFSN